MTLPHLYYAFSNGFSGQTIFDDYYISFYNLFFTSWPLVIKGAFEQDISYDTEGESLRKLYPYLYYIGQRQVIFNWTNYMRINFLGFIHSLLVYLIPVWIFQEHHVLLPSGQNIDIWSLSITSFTCMFTVVTLNLVVWTRYWTWVSFFFYSILSIFVYIGYVWLSNIMDFG